MLVSQAVCKKNISDLSANGEQLTPDQVVTLTIPHKARLYQVAVRVSDVTECPPQGIMLNSLVQYKVDPITQSEAEAASFWAQFEANWLAGCGKFNESTQQL